MTEKAKWTCPNCGCISNNPVAEATRCSCCAVLEARMSQITDLTFEVNLHKGVAREHAHTIENLKQCAYRPDVDNCGECIGCLQHENERLRRALRESDTMHQATLRHLQEAREDFINQEAVATWRECAQCREKYPEASISSSMTCPDCRRRETLAECAVLREALEDVLSQAGECNDEERARGYCAGHPGSLPRLPCPFGMARSVLESHEIGRKALLVLEQAREARDFVKAELSAEQDGEVKTAPAWWVQLNRALEELETP